MRISFTGVPSSGKTTLAKKIVDLVQGIYVPEIPRIYINSLGRPLSNGDQYMMAKLQSNLERELVHPTKDLICETPIYIPAVYEDFYHNSLDSAKIVRLYKENNHKYDFIFHLSGLEYRKDGTRYQKKEELYLLNEFLLKYNSNQNLVIINSTDFAVRVSTVLRNMGRLNYN
jgi:nicotinamide riboside kinase